MPLYVVKTRILKLLCNIAKKAVLHNSKYVTRVDFWKEEYGVKAAGFFTKRKVFGLLKGKDYD